MQNLEHVDPLEPPQSPQEERESDEIEEQKHFQKVLMAFAYYRRHSLIMNNRRRYDYMLLSEQHKALVPHLLHKINHVDGLIEENTKILKEIVRGSGIFSDGDLRDSVSKTNTQKVSTSGGSQLQ